MSNDERWAQLLAAGKVSWTRGMRARLFVAYEPTGIYGMYLGIGPQFEQMHIHWEDNVPHGGPSRTWSNWTIFEPMPHVGEFASPDFTDPATLGCLLAQTWEAQCGLAIDSEVFWEAIQRVANLIERYGITDPRAAEALLAALEAAT